MPDLRLEDVRVKIDGIDAVLFILLRERFAAVDKAMNIKAASGIPSVDIEREKDILARAATYGSKVLRATEAVINIGKEGHE